MILIDITAPSRLLTITDLIQIDDYFLIHIKVINPAGGTEYSMRVLYGVTVMRRCYIYGGKRKRGKGSAENRKGEVCRKPENDIFESRKAGKLQNICRKLKIVF